MDLTVQQPMRAWLQWPQQIPQHHYHISPPTQAYNVPSYNAGFMMISPAQMQYMPQFQSSSVSAPTTSYCESTQHVTYPSPPQTVTSPAPFTMCNSQPQNPSVGEQSGSVFKPHQQTIVQSRKPLRNSALQSRPPIIPKEILNSKTITVNQNPNENIEFDTSVDQLMRAIQFDKVKVKEEPQQMLTPSPSPKQEPLRPPGPPSCASDSIKKSPSKPKKYICTGPNCNKTFSQKTHLTIHLRTHSGLRPYKCEFEGCGRTFSQLGNLKTHARRHSGEKPFKCSQCDKAFVQKSNVRSHERTHSDVKPFTCILDRCTKKFTQLGNMKAHQNNYHREVLRDLTSKFCKFSAEGHVPTEYGRLFEYFKIHYKNSNKGVKGRGKARKVIGREDRSKPAPAGGPRHMWKMEPAVSQPSSQLSPGQPKYTPIDGLMPIPCSVPSPIVAGQMPYSHTSQMITPSGLPIVSLGHEYLFPF